PVLIEQDDDRPAGQRRLKDAMAQCIEAVASPQRKSSNACSADNAPAGVIARTWTILASIATLNAS
ncbi:hypothetical protein, partial [Klebsiella pneumoniae]|uniref:hypothetical protein n=1 Tax=Klebsiella pneumoniae TaxID=573 RepID=UPI003AB9707C